MEKLKHAQRHNAGAGFRTSIISQRSESEKKRGRTRMDARQPGRTGRPKFHVEIKDGGHEVRSGPGAGGGRTCRPPSSRGSKGKASSSSVHHVALHCLATARNDRFVRLPRAFRCRLQLRHQRARDGASRWLPLPSLWLCVTVLSPHPTISSTSHRSTQRRLNSNKLTSALLAPRWELSRRTLRCNIENI